MAGSLYIKPSRGLVNGWIHKPGITSAVVQEMKSHFTTT